MQTATQERRSAVRLTRGMRVEAAMIDRYDQPAFMLRDVQVVNVSPDGLALISTTRVKPGTTLQITTDSNTGWLPAQGQCKARVLHCTPTPDQNALTLHCSLSEGAMPASLIYNWT